MHKRKDGKIVASLTEVKNKTGDIFSLVDEFGEILLTSYNKPKYKIIKIDISESISFEEKQVESTKKNESVIERVRKTMSKTTEPEEISVEKDSEIVYLINEDIIHQLKSLKPFARNQKSERRFVSILREPLQ